MIPTSNNNNLGCNPISSNCVLWQGPDINCGNLVICNGDSVSDVVAKLAEELCDATYNPTLNIDVNCLTGIADPTNLDEVVQAIIDKICETPEPTPGSAVDPTFYPLPTCLQTEGKVQAQLGEYVQIMAAKVCTNVNAIVNITNQLNNLTQRVVILESYFPLNSEEVEIVSQCILKDQTVPLSELVAAFEEEYCLFSAAVGTEALIRKAISAQCVNGNDSRLSGAGTFSGVSNWNSSSQGLTLAQSHENQWIVICDLYNAVTGILENCCGGGCDSVNFGYTYSITLNQTTNLPENLNINFTASQIPADFDDCNGATNVALTDSNGNSVTFPVNVKANQNNSSGVNYDLSSSGLNLTNPIQIKVPFCVTNGSDTCSETQTETITLAIPCPTGVLVTSPQNDSVRVQFDAALPTDYYYEIRLLNNNSIVNTYTVTSPGVTAPVDYVFSGLSQGTEYCIKIAIGQGTPVAQGTNATSVICDGGCVTTAGALCTTGEYTSNTAGAPVIAPISSIFLGTYDFINYAYASFIYFDAITAKIYREIDLKDGTYAKGVSFYNYTITSGGSIQIDLVANNGGLDGADNIFYEYSLDNGLTYQGLTSVAVTNSTPQTVTINTGATSGTIYLKAYTSYNAKNNKSIPSTLRYDFITDEFIPLFDLYNTDPTKRGDTFGPTTVGNYKKSMVGGQLLNGTNILQTDGNSFTVPSGTTSSRWVYYGKMYDSDGIAKHCWGGIRVADTGDEALTKVVLACDCPAFVNQTEDFESTTYVPLGGSASITIPYIIGGGTPYMTIISQPQFGSLTHTPGDNTVLYTNTNTSGFSDTFTVRFSSEIEGECLSSEIYTVQLQFYRGKGGGFRPNKEMYMFVDTTSYATTDAGELKAIRDKIKKETLAESPSWAGEVYMIPVNSPRFLSYAKSIVDDGASASLDTDPAWVAVRNLPPSWTGGTYSKQYASLFIMSNAAPAIYHDTTLAAGFGSTPNIQPRTQYLEDYEEYLDIVNGTEISAWAQAQGFGGTPPFDDLVITYYPITTDTTGSNASAILQGLASYAGKMINPLEYGVKTAVDVTGYLMQGLVPSAINPYEGSVTSGGVSVLGLYREDFNMFLNQPTKNTPLNDYLQEMLTENAGGFLDKLNKTILGTTGGSTEPAVGPKYEVDICGSWASFQIIQDISGGAPLVVGEFYTFYVSGSPLTGEVIATSVAAADYVSAYHSDSIATAPECDNTEAPYGNWRMISCGEVPVVYNLKVTNQTLYPGLILTVTNNSGVSIFSENGTQELPNGGVLCFTIDSLAIPEDIAGEVDLTNTFPSCETCITSLLP